MHKFLLCLLTIVIASVSQAQNQDYKNLISVTVKGIIVDSTTQSSLVYVTIVVQEIEKNKIIRNILTSEDGSFKLTNLPDGEYKIILSYVGYKTKTVKLPDLTTSTADLGILVLTPVTTELEEVQVVTQKPLIEQSFDRITYNIDADPEANNLSTLDMLRKIPLLTIDAQDNLQLNGSNNYQILVNGKRSALFAGNPGEVLKILPANTIRKVEIITNPSARYEATGASGIINIVTRNKSISGYSGSVNLATESPEGNTAGAFLTTTVSKLSASTRYNYRYSNSPLNKSTFLRDDFINYSQLKQTSESKSKNKSQLIVAELSYQFTAQDLITASFSQHTSNDTYSYTQLAEQLNATKEITEAFKNLNTDQSKTVGQDIALEYERSFKKNDKQLLSLSVNTTSSSNSSHSNITLQPVLNYTGRESIANTTDKTSEHTIQVDYVQPIGKQILELGAKSILEKSNSNYLYQNQDTETNLFVPDTTMSNSFTYSQNIHAAYISSTLTIGKWGLRTGARLEASNLQASFLSTASGVEKEYYNIFPNVSLSRSLKESSRISLSYNKRITRPGLYFLNPYVNQTDPLNISYGNPNLVPANSHTFQLEYGTFIKTTSLNINAFHSFTNNAIEQLTTLSHDSVAHTTYGNIGQTRNSGLTLSGSTTIFKILSFNLNSGVSYIAYTKVQAGETHTNKGLTYNLRGAANLRIGQTWRIGGNLSYNSPNILVQGKFAGYTWSSFSVNKQFLKDGKANLNLVIKSPFTEKRHNLHEISSPNFYQRRESYTTMRQVSLAFNYRFGKLR